MKKIQGFTLIELLITMFIIITLSAVMIPKFYNYDKETKLDIAANEIKEAILETQSLALAPPTSSNDVEYYFIRFTTRNYQIFEQKSTGESIYSQMKNLPSDLAISRPSGSLPFDLIFRVENKGRADTGLTLELRQNNGPARQIIVLGETGQVTIQSI